MVQVMTKELAEIELLGLENDAKAGYSKEDIIDFFVDKELHKTVRSYLTRLWDYTVHVSGSIVEIGKIVLNKIVDFIKENPNMAFGAALGAIAGAMASIFIGWIPFVGQALSALCVAGGMLIGAIAGNRMDRVERGEYVDDSIMSIFGDIISVAKKFIQFFVDIIQTIRDA